VSVHITAPVWKIKSLTMTQKIILLKLADNANEAGICWPSLSTIAEDCRCSVRTVSRAIAHFEGIDLIDHDRRFNKSNMYHFNIDTLSILSSSIDTVSNTPRHTVQSIETPCLVNVDTLSSQYGHPCPTNRQEPKRTINEPSIEPSEEDEYEDPFDEADSIRLKEMADQRKFG